jgi:hypothetical protein
MIEAAIVPDHQVSLAPLVPVTKARIVHEREKLVEYSLRRIRRCAVDRQGESGRKIERGAPGLRMRAHNRLTDSRDRGGGACAFFLRRVVECAGEARIERLAQ